MPMKNEVLFAIFPPKGHIVTARYEQSRSTRFGPVDLNGYVIHEKQLVSVHRMPGCLDYVSAVTKTIYPSG
jgi:hypothetical protein